MIRLSGRRNPGRADGAVSLFQIAPPRRERFSGTRPFGMSFRNTGVLRHTGDSGAAHD
jgi:hypothetical protein